MEREALRPGATSSTRLLVSDIDGTLLEDGVATAGLETLRLLIESRGDSIRVVYATGRSFQSTWTLVLRNVLPVPNAIASAVGTEVWLPPWTEASEEFERSISKGWDRQAVVDVVEEFREVDLQPGQFQTPLKVSFFLRNRAMVPAIGRALKRCGLECRLVYSGGRFLDALPVRAGKRNAIKHIVKTWGMEDISVLACGDSTNDLDMIRDPRFHGVVVGNSERQMRNLRESKLVHVSKLPYAAGVLEGAETFHFWP